MATYQEAIEHLKQDGEPKARLPDWLDPDAYIYFDYSHTHVNGETPIGTIMSRSIWDNRGESKEYDHVYFPVNGEETRDDWVLIEPDFGGEEE